MFGKESKYTGHNLFPLIILQLDDLLTEADVGENVQIDRVLMEACGDVLDKDCANTKAKG